MLKLLIQIDQWEHFQYDADLRGFLFLFCSLPEGQPRLILNIVCLRSGVSGLSKKLLDSF